MQDVNVAICHPLLIVCLNGVAVWSSSQIDYWELISQQPSVYSSTLQDRGQVLVLDSQKKKAAYISESRDAALQGEGSVRHLVSESFD